ncbi:MAG: RagB/SusD family nutrient uptake outer membrane protein [bacterium]|nr:RagB/SusD family nutrient uptake outer membrane protein [bacterium]
MKNILKKVSLLLLAFVVLTPACTDLEEELFSDVTSDNFFSTDEEFIAAMGAAYTSLYSLGNHSNLWSINELASDELVVAAKGGDWFDGGVLIQLHQHTYTADNGFFNNTWTQCYGGVNTCNRLIAQFEAIESESSAAFIAELRGLRALWYFWLMDAFGNIPLVTSFDQTDAPSNSSRTEVFNFIMSELDEIIPLLDENNDASTYGRFNKWAGLALRARMNLNAEVYTGTARYAQAITDADEILNDGGFSLESVYANNFAAENSGSAENIFVIPYDQVFAQGFNWSQMTLHYGSQNTYNLAAQPWNGYAAVEEFYNSYVDPDQNPGPQGPVYTDLATATTLGTVDSRLSNFLVGPQFDAAGDQITDPGVEDADPDGPGLNFTPEINEIFPNSLRQAGARIGKYAYTMGSTQNMDNDFVLFRLGEVILTKAEAEFREGNTAEALTYINMIRARAGVTEWTSLTLDQIYAERGREMFAELVRRSDQIRFDTYDDPWWEKDADAGPFLEIFPIPQAQLDASSALNQNDGYN